MPKMVTIGAAPGYKPDGKGTEKALQIKAYGLIKDKGNLVVSYQTAIQNIRNSKGMYELKEAKAAPVAVVEMKLEDRSLDELKVMMLSLGVKTEKQMSKTDVIMLIQKKLDEVEITEDEE